MAILAAVVALIAVTCYVLGWNSLRHPVASYISHRLGRDLSIDGNLRVRLSNPIEIEAEEVKLANTSWAADPLMADISRVVLRVDRRALFSGDIILSEILLGKPRLSLEKSESNEANWVFGNSDSGKEQSAPIGLLTIENGFVRYRDPELGADISLHVDTSTQSSADNHYRIAFKGEGRFHRQPFFVEGSGGPLLSLREAGKPYQLDINARAGVTKASFRGQLIPGQLEGLAGRMELQGDDLSKLYPLFPLPLPWTPPYKIAGRLAYEKDIWSFNKFTGQVGKSDLSGDVSFDRSHTPRSVSGNLISRRLHYKDLGGFAGVPPGEEAEVRNSAEQKDEAEKRAASSKVLSYKPYRFEQLRQVNANIQFRGERVVADELQVESLFTHIYINNGQLKLQPLDFGIGGGHVTSNILMDARKEVMNAKVDAGVRDVELSAILPQLKPPKGNAGKVGGRARLSSTGNSLAQLLGGMDGELALIEWGGQASTLTLVLTNLDLARAAQLLLRGDDTSRIRCVVANFDSKDGVMTAKSLIMDTTAVNIIGEGRVDFTKEIYDLRLRARSKRPSLLALRGPIEIRGPFKNPNIGPAMGPVATRLAASITLGTLATPLAALIPLIDVGGGKDSDCSALIAEARADAGKKPGRD